MDKKIKLIQNSFFEGKGLLSTKLSLYCLWEEYNILHKFLNQNLFSLSSLKEQSNVRLLPRISIFHHMQISPGIVFFLLGTYTELFKEQTYVSWTEYFPQTHWLPFHSFMIHTCSMSSNSRQKEICCTFFHVHIHANVTYIVAF